MLISLHSNDPRPLYVQIIDEIRRALAVGTLRADDPLPSVRQLAGELRINPNTVAQAYRELERLGIAAVRRGQGTYIAARTAAPERSALAREVAARALLDAHRHGITAAELADAVRAADFEESATPAAEPAKEPT